MVDSIAIDLFSGLGGMSEGLAGAGLKVVAAVEKNALAAKAFRMNHPGVRVWEEDIRTVDAELMRQELGLARGELDLLAACPPCQGFSSIRTLNKPGFVEDDRNSLVLEVQKFVTAFEPKGLIFENVPALARDTGFQELKNYLVGLRYKVAVKPLNAQDYLVPQRRRRLFLIASREREPSFPEASKERKTVQDVLLNLPDVTVSDDPLHKSDEKRSERIKKLIGAIPRDGGSRSALSLEYQLDCHVKCDGFKDVYGRMAWKSVAPTITGGCLNPSKGRFLHPDEDRAITLREALILQGFRADYQLPLERGRYAAADLVSNAVPPPLIESVARRLMGSTPSVTNDV